MPEARAAPGDRLLRLDLRLAITLLLMLGMLAPLLVVPGTFFPYVVPRNVLFRVAVELSAALLLARITIGGRRLDLRGEAVLVALFAYLAAITLSAIVSPARSHSVFGDFERMGGVWAWLHLVLFFLVLRSLDRRYLMWLLRGAVAISVCASAHAIIERFFGLSGWTTGGLSLVGNPGLFAGYLLMAIPLAAYLGGQRGKDRWAYLAAAAVNLVALVLTQNRSSVLGLMLGTVVAALLVGLVGDGKRRRWVPFGYSAGVAVLLIALVAMARGAGDDRGRDGIPGVIGRLALTDFTGRDASRAIQWEAALAGFRDRPVLGYGPENHHLVWSANFDPRAYDLGADVFDRTHNAFLEALATTGIVGMSAFIAIWWSVGYSLYRALRSGRLSAWELSMFAGANVAYAVYLAFWFVDLNAAMLWLLAAAVVAARSNPAGIVQERRSAGPRSSAIGAAGLVVTGFVLAFVLQRHAYAPLRTSFALATLDSHDGDRDRAFRAVSIVSASGAPQTSQTGPVLGQFIASLEKRGELASSHGDSARRENIDRTFAAAIAAYEAELSRDPLNDRLHASAARVLLAASRFYDSPTHHRRAISLLERAIDLSPRRTEQRQLLEQARSQKP